MADQSKRKGKRTVGTRLFADEEICKRDHGKYLKDLFETFIDRGFY